MVVAMRGGSAERPAGQQPGHPEPAERVVQRCRHVHRGKTRPAGPVRVHQRPGGRRRSHLRLPEVHDDASPPGADDRVHERPAQRRRLHITADRHDSCLPGVVHADARSRVGRRGGRLGGVVEPVTEPVEDPAQEPGDVHLRHAEIGGDPFLGHVPEEVQAEDLTVPVREVPYQVAQDQLVAHRQQGTVFGTDELVPLGGVVRAGHLGVQRAHVVDRGGAQRLHDLMIGDPERRPDLRDAGCPPQALDERGLRSGDGEIPLLQPAGHVHVPPVVAEVPLELPGDRGDEVAEERPAARRVESVHGLDQPQRSHLPQVVGALAAVQVPAGQPVRERQVELDDPGPDPPSFAAVGRIGHPSEQRCRRAFRVVHGAVRRPFITGRGHGTSILKCHESPPSDREKPPDRVR
ncbi:hypothetical protein COUCH_26830 [Couchioplanes caeruleus]|nr:hypothetical protein [Couchioplanes caeruleus]UQU62631.1 hypothetical protein COUCH_26830 [Couchioplanes caeruleus]